MRSVAEGQSTLAKQDLLAYFRYFFGAGYETHYSGDVALCYTPDFGQEMKKRCSPQLVKKIYEQTQSWRGAAQKLNSTYGVNLPHLAWRDYATKRREIADTKARTKLLLGPRTCPTCHTSPNAYFVRLLKHLRPLDLRRWQDLRNAKKFKAAKQLIDEVYSRKITNK